jgi:hypothetical protein
VVLDANDNVIYDPSDGDLLVGRKIYIRNNVGLNPVTLKY